MPWKSLWVRGHPVGNSEFHHDFRRASLIFQNRKFTRWWFQNMFYFHLHLGEDSHFDDHMFSNGLKPPTSLPFL